MPREDQIHLTFYLPKELMNEIQFIVSAHKDLTGFDLSISAAIRGLIADGIAHRKTKKNEYSASHPSSRKQYT